VKEFNFAKLIAAVLTLSQVRATLMFKHVTARAGENIVPRESLLDRILNRKWLKRAEEVETRGRNALKRQNEVVRNTLDVALPVLIENLRELDLTFTLAEAERFKEKFDKDSGLPDEDEIGVLQFRLLDEVQSRRFVGLGKEFGGLYNSQQFPADVRAKFLSGVFEIDEASNCLALERGTASVFHLMRVMEIAVRATASCLGVPDPTKGTEKNWGAMFIAIRAGMKAKWPTAADRMSGDGQFFESLMASLEAVKNPWRNATMHVEITYTVAEADRIRHAVEGLMITMASRFDEKGEPKA